MGIRERGLSFEPIYMSRMVKTGAKAGIRVENLRKNEFLHAYIHQCMVETGEGEAF